MYLAESGYNDTPFHRIIQLEVTLEVIWSNLLPSAGILTPSQTNGPQNLSRKHPVMEPHDFRSSLMTKRVQLLSCPNAWEKSQVSVALGRAYRNRATRALEGEIFPKGWCPKDKACLLHSMRWKGKLWAKW